MTTISQLTLTKTKVKYIISYIIYTALYIINPILIMKFVDFITERQIKNAVIFAVLALVNFVLIQLFGFILSFFVGKVESENFALYHSKINNIVKNNGYDDELIDDSKLSQYLGQYYEKCCSYFFIQKVEMVFSFLTIIIIYTVMFILDWRITLILLFFIPLSFFVSKKYEKKLYSNADRNIENSDLIKKYIFDQKKLSKVEKFSTLKQMPEFQTYVSKYEKDYKNSVITNSKYLYFFSYSFLNLAILIVILLSGYLTYNNILTIGSLFAFQNYTSQLWTPAEFLMSYSSKYQEVKPLLKKIKNLLCVKQKYYPNIQISTINLRNYSPLDSDGNELFPTSNLNFVRGEIYLIEGQNGAGKTTLIESIMGFNERYKGKILINNEEIKSDDFAYVPADPFFSEFYDKQLVSSSSGQKKKAQLLFYLKSKKNVFIIDEPTNFIDDKNKLEILQLIKNKKSENNIIILISHDMIIEKIATKIIKIDKNKGLVCLDNFKE